MKFSYYVYGAFVASNLFSVGLGFIIGNSYRAFKSLKNLTILSPKKKEVSSSINNIFNEELQNRNDDDILKIGINKKPPTEIGGLLISSNGNLSGYATNKELIEKTEAYEKYKLTSDEYEQLVQLWKRYITDMNFYAAQTIVETKGYTLHIMQINKGRYHLHRTYDSTLINVSITDDNYNFATKMPSNTAKIREVIGMSGQN